MNVKLVLYTLMVYTVAQLCVWVQSFAQIHYPFLREPMWRFGLYMLSIPAGILFVEGTNLGKTAFDGETWPLRFLSFVAGTVVFAVLTQTIGGEGINTKTAITLGLCVLIIAVQIFWK